MTDRAREIKERKINRDEFWELGTKETKDNLKHEGVYTGVLPSYVQTACSKDEQPVSFNTSLYRDTTDSLTNHIKQKDFQTFKEIHLTIHGLLNTKLQYATATVIVSHL